MPGMSGARRWRPLIIISVAGAVCCIAVSVAAATKGYAELTRKPTATEIHKAAAAEVARRWMAWPAGKIFPGMLSYQAGPGVTETVRRVGIGSAVGCAAAVGPSLTRLLTQHGCRAVLRASYTDGLQGVVYTIGVAAFPGATSAEATEASMPSPLRPAAGLRALAFQGTAAALFTDQARQAATAAQSGPYVVLTTAGYADGRSAAATGQARPSVFAPGSQLGQAVLVPLATPATPRCDAPQWRC